MILKKKLKVSTQKRQRRQRSIIAFLIKYQKNSASISHKLFNKSIEKNKFLQNLKVADITPVCKKNNLLDKKNYQPVIVLPAV